MTEVQQQQTVSRPEKDAITTFNNAVSPEDGTALPQKVEDPVDPCAQAGVQDVQALASVWTTTSMIVAYVMIWLVFFFMLMQQAGLSTLTTYVTSSFQQHSLTPTVSIMSSIISGVLKLTIAKVLDVFGRPQGYLLAIVITTIGLVMMAACNQVEMYAAAQAFYWVGNTAMLFTLNIFVADTSSLRNRGIMLAFSSSPGLITVWVAGPLTEAYLMGPGWRWCFGTFAIIIPVITMPLFALFIYNHHKAKSQGLIPDRASGRTTWQSVVYYCREFDAFGLLLLSGGLALFLLPLNIHSLQEQGWRSPLIISLLVFGILLIAAFIAWERFWAPVTCIPYSLLMDPMIIGACMLGATLFVSSYTWMAFFTSFLMVVNGLSITHATYVSQIYTIGSTLFTVVAGILVRYTGRFKPLTLYLALPLHILGMGLMIVSRQPDSNIGYIIMCQIFISAAGGMIMITDTLAAMSAVSHQHIAMIVAVLSMFSEIGGAFGLTAASTIWQDVFPRKLAEYLPATELENLLNIYADITVQLSYPEGSPARLAIQHAYGDAQKAMLIAGTAVWAAGVVGVLMWRNINVKDMKQVKGNVI